MLSVEDMRVLLGSNWWPADGAGPGRLRSFGRQFAQVRLGELDEFFSAAGQDRPGRVQGEALDLAEGELGRQGEFLPGGVDVDQGLPVVPERGSQRVLEFVGLGYGRAEQPGWPAPAARSSLSACPGCWPSRALIWRK